MDTKHEYEDSPAAISPPVWSLLTKMKPEDWDVSVFRSVQGGGTGEEFPENLKKDGESPGNKWYDCCVGPTWIQANFKKPVRIKFLQLKSANDCQRRDPYDITISVLKPGETEFTEIFEFMIIFEERYQVLDLHVDTVEEVSTLRIAINRNYSAKIGEEDDGTQLAQVIFYV
jgi:hypothetical protein